MAEENISKQRNKFAILIHQLELEDTDIALSYFSKQSIEKVSYAPEGLQIVFKEYDLVIKSIRREKIEVGGLFYKIYPLVTNLTICGIGPYATDSTIQEILQKYQGIIDLYRIQEVTEYGSHKTVSLTDDYRMILDVPEILAPKLMPLRLSDVSNRTFEVLFFCRLCRCNGHMQFQCLNATKNSSSHSSHQNRNVSRKMSYENDSATNYNKINHSPSNFCVNEQRSKIKLNSHVKTEKNNFSHEKYFENMSYKNSSLKNDCKEEEKVYSKTEKHRNKIEDSNIDNREKQRQENFSSISNCDSEKFKDNNSPSLKEEVKSYSNSKKHYNKIEDYNIDSRKKQWQKNFFSISDCDSKKFSDNNSSSLKEEEKRYPKSKKRRNNIEDYNIDSRKKQWQKNFSSISNCDSKNFRDNNSPSLKEEEKTYSKSKKHHNKIEDYNIDSRKKQWKKKCSSISDCDSKKFRDNNSSSLKEEEKRYPKSKKHHNKIEDYSIDSRKKQWQKKFSLILNCDSKKFRDNNSSSLKEEEKTYSKLKKHRNEREDSNIDNRKKQRQKNFPSISNYDSENFRNNNSLTLKEEEKTYSKSKKHRNEIEDSDIDNRKKQRQENCFSISNCDNEKFGDKNSPSLMKSSSEILDRRNFQKSCHQYSGIEEYNGKIQASTSNECNDEQTFVNGSQRKSNIMKILSKLLPPNTDFYETERLIRIAYKCSPEDIPEDCQAVLFSILEYSRELESECVGKTTIHFLNWINAVLNKIEEKKIADQKSHKSSTHYIKKEKERDKDEKLGTKSYKEQSSVRRVISLSLGIKEAISRTNGELRPALLCNFLNQARNRKNLLPVVSVFTKNIPLLASQLLDVQNTYYKYVQKRGPEEDRDISYMKRLRLRLLQLCGNATQISIEADVAATSVKIEPEMTEVPFVKSEADVQETFEEEEPDITDTSIEKSNDIIKKVQFVESEPDMQQISVQKESDRTGTFIEKNNDVAEVQFIKSELGMHEIFVKKELDIADTVAESNYDMAEVLVKREDEIFMRQSANLYAASYYSNITQMPISLDSIKTEILD